MKAYFAGGCFWCITPIYKIYGVTQVTCGYSGGKEPFPTYAEVKAQKTGHRETLELVYEPGNVRYDLLLDIFLSNIDPFDGEGQYIDRGFSYTPAIYYQNDYEKETAERKIAALEESSEKKVKIAVEPFRSFYPAEEMHQDYYLKNPENFAHEMAQRADIGGKLYLELADTEWAFDYTDHDRQIVRAIVIDDENNYYFVRVHRDDRFGKATLIETSGGGVEPGEDFETAIKRELKEELGADVGILFEIGLVSDYYNLIHRHNLNRYYLCFVRSWGQRHLTEQEIDDFHLSTLKLTYDEAEKEYEKNKNTPLGRLIAQRELPVLRRAKELLKSGI